MKIPHTSATASAPQSEGFVYISGLNQGSKISRNEGFLDKNNEIVSDNNQVSIRIPVAKESEDFTVMVVSETLSLGDEEGIENGNFFLHYLEYLEGQNVTTILEEYVETQSGVIQIKVGSHVLYNLELDINFVNIEVYTDHYSDRRHNLLIVINEDVLLEPSRKERSREIFQNYSSFIFPSNYRRYRCRDLPREQAKEVFQYINEQKRSRLDQIESLLEFNNIEYDFYSKDFKQVEDFFLQNLTHDPIWLSAAFDFGFLVEEYFLNRYPFFQVKFNTRSSKRADDYQDRVIYDIRPYGDRYNFPEIFSRFLTQPTFVKHWDMSIADFLQRYGEGRYANEKQGK